MSYILDALRRADAERTRGAVPGLHAQNIPADNEPAARNFRPLIWAAGAAGVLVVAVVTMLIVAPWRGAPAPDARTALAPESNAAARGDGPATTARGEMPAARPGAIEPAALPVEPPISRANTNGAATDAANAEGRAPRQVVATAPAVLPQQLAGRAAEGRVGTLEPTASARKDLRDAQGRPTRPADSGAAPSDASPYARANATAAATNTVNGAANSAEVEHYGPPAGAAPAAPAAPAPARPAKIPNINDLPPATRAELPRLNVGGAIYSESASSRMVILNGQVFHEGDKPAADTVLEQIRLKSAVLNFRGQRYEITY